MTDEIKWKVLKEPSSVIKKVERAIELTNEECRKLEEEKEAVNLTIWTKSFVKAERQRILDLIDNLKKEVPLDGDYTPIWVNGFHTAMESLKKEISDGTK